MSDITTVTGWPMIGLPWELSSGERTGIVGRSGAYVSEDIEHPERVYAIHACNNYHEMADAIHDSATMIRELLIHGKYTEDESAAIKETLGRLVTLLAKLGEPTS